MLDDPTQLQRFTQFAVDNLADAAYCIDIDANIVYVNDAATRMLGYSREEFLRMRITDLDPGVTLEIWTLMWEALRQAQRRTIEVRHRAKDGSIVPVEIAANLLVFEGNEYSCAFARDISERKLAEERMRAKDDALQAARTELARVSRVVTMGELTASIAHEVNQPLGAIILHGDAARRWLARKPPNAPETLRAIEAIMANAHRARDVIVRIRALASQADQPHEVLDLSQLVREVLEIARGELRQADISVRTELGAARARGDRVQLQQVLLNLIMNAMDAMTAREHGPRELFIRTSDDTERSVHVEVRDSGIGVSEGAVTKIFEPFYTTKAQGIGIGLSISRSIIEAHSGRLWAERHENAPGLTLHVSLPRADSTAEPGAQ